MKRIFIIFIALLFVSVSVYSVVKNSSTSSDSATKPLISVSVSPETATYTKGQLVVFKLTVKNVSNKKFVSYFPTSQKLDLVVRNENKEKVWQLSKGKMFTMAVTPFSLNVKASVSYTAFWDQKDDSGKQVLAGKYFVSGTLMTSKKHKTGTAVFEIK